MIEWTTIIYGKIYITTYTWEAQHSVFLASDNAGFKIMTKIECLKKPGHSSEFIFH